MTGLQMQSQRRTVYVHRLGMTLIELIVVIVVIVVLASLIAPALQSSRPRPRKLECLSNIRNVGLAMQNFASGNDDRLTPLTSTIQVGPAEAQVSMDVGWPIQILPALDQAALYRSIKQNSTIEQKTATIANSDKIWLKVFTCSDDPKSIQKPGGLSYVVNAGFISSEVWATPETATLFHQPYLINWKGSTTPPYRSTDGTSKDDSLSDDDLNVAVATGVFWRIVGDPDTAFKPSLEYIAKGDGTGCTIMVAENLNAGPWYGTDVNAIGFGIRIPLSQSNHAPSVGTTEPYGEFDTVASLNSSFSGSTLAKKSSGSWINQRDSGPAPRPSSNHTGGVNVVMADGSARFLSDNINPLVYARLITSNGVAFGEKELMQSDY